MTRGFAAIGLHRPKDRHNIGGVLRAAQCYRAACVALSGERIDARRIKAATNTMQTHRHIPVYRGELRDLIPYGAMPVAVDLVDGAESLVDFVHPQSAFYIFGPEDGTLGAAILDWCPRRVMVPTAFCMNLAATVNVVLYDRLAKQTAQVDTLPQGGDAKQAPGESLSSAVGAADAPETPSTPPTKEHTQ